MMRENSGGIYQAFTGAALPKMHPGRINQVNQLSATIKTILNGSHGQLEQVQQDTHCSTQAW
jgi:hypothetical protein